MAADTTELVYYRTQNDPPGAAEAARQADPVTTEIIRRALDSAAKQMKQAMIRTSFSPIIYESLDFAVVLYDRHIRLLAQAPTQPLFMGNMSFAIENAVQAVGGADALEPGDVIVYNIPYGSGSHAQDCALVMPVFGSAGELVGYAANKAHWLDVGALAPYCTDTTDVYQEGVVIPGLKLYKRGERNDDVFRLILANCRFKQAVEGDINAQLASLHVGARELVRVMDRFGLEVFNSCVERMFDHGERVVREFISRVPDGTYRASCRMDDNKLQDTPIEFQVVVVIDGSNARFDFSEAPDALPLPSNCPQPSTVCASRITLAMLAGKAHETPNEGSFRPLEVVTRPGSMFHPVEPQPCYLYAWPAFAAMEGICEAFAHATDGALPSGSAGDLVGVMLYGAGTDTREPFVLGGPLPVGHGAFPDADGTTLYHIGVAHARLQAPELQEAKAPVLYERWEYTPNSGGAGEFRGGDGWELHVRFLDDAAAINTVERTRVPSWAQRDGHTGAPNRVEVDFADGHSQEIRKVTDLPLPAGTRVRIYCGGGGGYGDPASRAPEAVQRDLLEGRITPEHAQAFYPHALESGDGAGSPPVGSRVSEE
jgi:N-methylhydantoinase B